MSSKPDLLIHGGHVVTPEGICRADIGVAEGRIVMVEHAIRDAAAATIDATGLYVFPGILDAHVHFNEPGRTDWEGLATGSASLAAGGGTWFCDMPLNSSPPVLNAATFNGKRRLAEEKSATDFSLWGGLVPDNPDKLEELRDAGAVGFKAFMCESGLNEFPHVDAVTLRTGMKRSAALGMIVAVHAEDNAMAAQLTAARRVQGGDVRAWLASRPVDLELAAICTATDIAGETGCALHIVHVSSAAGLALIADARTHGVNVSAETCPHYLLLNEDDLLRIGAPAKCAPPLRPEPWRQDLWRAVGTGAVDTIGSDHSPAPPEMKSGDDFFSIWGGISGCQHGFPLLLSEALARDPASLPHMAALLAANVANRFRLPHKGRIAAGCDADFTLLDLRSGQTLQNASLLYRHRQGPYHGRRCSVAVRATFVRGRQAWSEGVLAPAAGKGRFIQPILPHHA